MKVAFVTPELLSLVRRTNLAGVAESLSQALLGAGADVRVFLPATQDVQRDALHGLAPCASVVVPDGKGKRTFRIHEGRLDRLPVYLFENESIFGTRHPYGDQQGPYQDNWRRYALFSRAVLASFERIGFPPDVIHGMDWTTGLIPVLHQIEVLERDEEHVAQRAGTFFAIHNLAMQGVFEREILPHVGIPHRFFRDVGGIELAGKVNFLTAGAEFATVIGTHSASHALKIQEKDRGYGLEETFQRRKKELVGITNGIDYLAWNPADDPVLAANYSATDKDPAGKRKCKQHLQNALKLDVGPRTPIACSIGRWDADTGFDLLAEILTPVLERGVELVVMGSGQHDIQDRLRTMESTFVGRCRVLEGYHARTAHTVLAGADMLLLPSHYQPSNPLFAIGMRYGTVPIVYAHGGLEDTVVDVVADEKTGTGFHFQPYTSDGLLESIETAVKRYKNASGWKALLKRCMEEDFSWEATAKEYLKAYRRVTRRTRARLAAG